MKIDCIIGIDPGASGGITIWRPNALIHTVKMPKDLKDIYELLKHYNSICNPLVFLEKLSVRQSDSMIVGKIFQNSKMLANYEQLKAVLEIGGTPFVLVHPLKWQSALKIRVSRKETTTERKRRFKLIAAQYYPDLKATLWNADSTLIMQFGRFILRNDIKWVLENLPDKNHNKLF